VASDGTTWCEKPGRLSYNITPPGALWFDYSTGASYCLPAGGGVMVARRCLFLIPILYRMQ